MPRLSLAVVAALLAGGPAAAGPTPAGAPTPVVRSFEIVHRPIDEAYRAIAPLLSDLAEVTISRSARRIELRDAPERVAAAAEALRAFDVAPQRVRLFVRLVKGERGGEPRPPAGAGEVEALLPRDVRELVAFHSFETLGSAEIPAEEGMRASAAVGADERFRVDVRIGAVDALAGRIALDSLALARRVQGGDGRPVWRPLFEFKELLEAGQTRVLFATASPSDRRALFLILEGRLD